MGIVLAAAIRLAWGQHGSIAAADWLSTSILVALVLATVVAAGVASRPGGPMLAAGGVLLALAAWDGASASWAPSPALARDEALLVATYALALVLPSLCVRTGVEGALVLGVVVAALAGTVLAAGVHLVLTGGANDFHDGRLNFPIGYPNAQAAFALVGFWPALAFAAGRRWAVPVRAAALGASCALLACWAATQSKGGGLGLVVSAFVVLGISRGRLRLSLPLFLSVALVGAAFLPLTAPYRTNTTHAFHGVGKALLLVGLAGTLVGLVYALLDRRVSFSPRARRIITTTISGLVTALVVITAIEFVVSVGSPTRFVQHRWESFKRLPDNETGQTHLLSLGSNRYDFWRVALGEFDRHPLAGDGARGFQDAYLLYRKSEETPARSHSLELDALSETGIIGFALLGASLVPLLWRLAARARTRLLSVGVLGAATVFLAHASVDWIWSFPAVTIPLFVLLGTGFTGEERKPLARRTSWVATGVAVLGALLVFGPPWLSARFTSTAESNGDAGALTWAKRLDPLSIEPLLAQSSLAATPGASVAALAAAAEKEPRSPALHYALGLALRRAGRTADARRELELALRLDPKDPLIKSALAG